jgi:hypothetical protein
MSSKDSKESKNSKEDEKTNDNLNVSYIEIISD